MVEKLASRRRLKFGDFTCPFFLLSYLAYIKKLSKTASLNALLDKKRAITREHLIEAHQTILEETKVRRKQRTLDEMLSNKRKSTERNGHI